MHTSKAYEQPQHKHQNRPRQASRGCTINNSHGSITPCLHSALPDTQMVCMGQVVGTLFEDAFPNILLQHLTLGFTHDVTQGEAVHLYWGRTSLPVDYVGRPTLLIFLG